jgi:hypothetical protein
MTLAAAALSTWAAALVLPAAASAGTTTALAAPTGIAVTPGVGSVTVSWTPLPLVGVVYTVTSTPAGKTCSVTDGASCSMADTVTTPWQFRVTASRAGSTTSPPSAPTAPLSPRLVLLEAGQSNATGYESYAVDPSTGTNYLAAPFTNGADSHDLITWLPWSVLPGAAGSPVPLDTPQQAQYSGGTFTIFGPEIGLARQLWADTGRAVTIVKAAYTSTSLAVNWSPLRTGAPPHGLFPATVAKVRATMAADAAAGQLDVLGGIYWYQGESDVGKTGWSKSYQANLTALIGAFRSNLPVSPSAPFAIVKVDTSAYWPYLASTVTVPDRKIAVYLANNARVRAGEDAVAAALPSVVTVDTADLPRVAPSMIHLTDVDQLTVGSRLAKATEALLP